MFWLLSAWYGGAPVPTGEVSSSELYMASLAMGENEWAREEGEEVVYSVGVGPLAR